MKQEIAERQKEITIDISTVDVEGIEDLFSSHINISTK